MAPLRSLNLIALAIVAIVALSSLPVPVNALVADRAQVARHVHGHNAIAKRKRDSSAQCQPRPSSSTPSPTPIYVAPAPSTATSSSSPAASPSTPASSDGQRKWGLAWNHDPTYLANFANLANVGFIYNWSPNIPAEAWNYPNLQRMPMLHDNNPVNIQGFQQTVHSGYGQYALGPNEPNLPKTYVSPSDAYNLWMQYINPLAEQGYTLVSPACVDDDDGIAWYKEFFGLCNSNSGCIVHILAFHAYTPDPQHTIDYANTLHDTYGLDVMITEFACQNYSGTGGQPDAGQVWDYAGKVKAFVNGASWIKGAFPFGIVPDYVFQNDLVDTYNELIDGNGNPTALAMFYLNQ